MASKRIPELDALRGLAAIAVVLFHYTVQYEALFGLPDQQQPWMVRNGYLGVQLFFIISGFVIFMSIDRTKRPLDFAFSRFSRLFPTYWASVSLTTLVVSVGWLPRWKRTPWEVLANMSMLHEFFEVRPVEGVYWSLSRELIFYGIVLTVFSLGFVRHWIRLAYCWLSIQLAVNLAIRLGGYVSWKIRFFTMTEFCHLFVAGIAFYEIYRVRLTTSQPGSQPALPVTDDRTSKVSWATLGVIVFAGFNHFLLPIEFPASRVEEGLYVLAFFGIMLAIIHDKARFLTAKPLVFLGSISYALYLTHQLLGYSIIRAFHANGLSSFLAIAVAIVVSILLATVLTRFVEQPSRKYLRRQYIAWRHGSEKPVIVVSRHTAKTMRFDSAENVAAPTVSKKTHETPHRPSAK